MRPETDKQKTVTIPHVNQFRDEAVEKWGIKWGDNGV